MIFAATSLVLMVGTPAPNDPVAAALEADVRHLVERLSPRDYRHTAELDQVAAWIETRFREAGTTQIIIQIFEVDGRSYRNVIGSFGPASLPAQSPKIIVGAHYDTAGPLPGANDNGSGVAALLALARRLGAEPPPARVELVAWTLEEPPYFATEFMGSAVHARALVRDRAVVAGVIALETLGVYRDTPGSQTYPDPAMAERLGDRGDFLAIVGRPEDGALIARVAPAFAGLIRAETLAAPPEVTGVAFSDHRSYWPHGFPAVMLTDTAFFRSARYHTADDTPDTLDYPRLAKVVAGVEKAVRALAAEKR